LAAVVFGCLLLTAAVADAGAPNPFRICYQTSFMLDDSALNVS
jgi:hypothetical protein